MSPRQAAETLDVAARKGMRVGKWELGIDGTDMFRMARNHLDALASLGEVSMLLNCTLKEYAHEPWAIRVRETIAKADTAPLTNPERGASK